MEAKNNNQQLNDMGVIEDDGWHGVNPCPGGHFLAQDEESIKPSLRRDERAWCPLVPSAGRVLPVRMGDLPWGGKPCMRAYGTPGRCCRVRGWLWGIGVVACFGLIGGVYVCG